MNHSKAMPLPPPEMSPKRRQVTDAAEALFLAHGYGAVSMDQVARTAGVSKATLYAYFASKDALFATIVSDKRGDEPFGEDMFPVGSPPGAIDLREALEDIGQRMLRFMLRERTLSIYRIALAESARFPEVGMAFYASGPCVMIQRFSDWLAVLRDAGLVQADDLQSATNQFLALVRCGVFLRRSLAMPPEASEAEINDTVSAAAASWMKAFATSKP